MTVRRPSSRPRQKVKFEQTCTKNQNRKHFSCKAEVPNGFDACWEEHGVDPTILDPVLLTFDPGRVTQKAKYLGGFFPAFFIADGDGFSFLEFFQTDKDTGRPTGIIAIEWLESMRERREKLAGRTLTEDDVKGMIQQGCRLTGAIPANVISSTGMPSVWVTTNQEQSRQVNALHAMGSQLREEITAWA